MEAIKVLVRTRWVEEDGTGEKCLCCGDNSFLSQARLQIQIGEGGHWIAQDIIFCCSCKDEVL